MNGVLSAPVLEVRGLSKRFGSRVAVEHLEFSLDRGECLGLLGPNGAGKTTTIKMLLGLVRMDAGTATVLGLDAGQDNARIKAVVGVAPQADSLDPDLSVLENLLTYASYFRIPRRTAHRKAMELLDFFALGNRQDEVITRLSGGQRRRLLLARALINEPKLLILDEPSIGLDPQARHLIWERLDTLKERGTTMLLTSHYMDEVERLSDRVLILDHGKVVAEGRPQQLITDLVGIEVFEVEAEPRKLEKLAAAFRQCNGAVERVGDRIYVYVREDCSHLTPMLQDTHTWVRRPANLEDLFIQLTGRDLKES